MSEATVVGQPMPLRLLLDRAVAVARRDFRAIYPSVAIPLALINGCFPLVQGLLMGPAMAGRTPDPSRVFVMVAGIFVAVGLLMVALLFGQGALYIAAVDAAAGRPVSMARAWRMVARPSVWATLLLSGVAFFAGLACCIVPGIYVGLLFSLVVPVMVEDGLRGTEALTRSAALIRYNPQGDLAADPRGKAFLIAFVGTLMGYALTFLLQLPFVVAQQVYIMRLAAGGRAVDPAAMMAAMTWFQVPSSMLGSLGQTAVQLYIGVGLALLHIDVRGRKEGIDLEAGVARIEGSQPPPVEGGAPPEPGPS